MTGAPSGSGLDGTYELKEDEKTKREEVCLDGCVYTREGQEYCFRSEPLATSPDVVCESGETGGATGGATGSTSAESADALASQAAAQTQARDAAAADKKAAEENKEAASAADSALDSVNLDSLEVRRRRQATTAYPKPTDCAGVTSGMQSVQDLLDINPSRALVIIIVLKSITSADATCSADEIASLKSMKTAAKEKARLAVNKFINAIAAAVTKLNAAVEALQAINTKLTAIGASTVATGTQAPAVATVFVPTTGSPGARSTGSAGTGSTGSPGVRSTGSAGTGSTGSAGTGSTGSAGTESTGSAGTGSECPVDDSFQDLLDFYDHTISFSDEQVTATCCTLCQTAVNVTCGLGHSCAAACSALSASLCPSHDCRNCQTLDDTSIDSSTLSSPTSTTDLTTEYTEEFTSQKKNKTGILMSSRKSHASCVSSASSSACNYCLREGCKVKSSPECCLHPKCRRRRRRKCKWIQRYLGNF